MFYPDKFTKSI